MLEIILICIIVGGCLGSIWAIFHVKKSKKKTKKEDKGEKKKEEKVKSEEKTTEKKEEKTEEKTEEKVEITEDIKLTKKPKLKIVKSATLQPKIERVYAPVEEEKEEELEPVAILKDTTKKPKKIVKGNGAKVIEKVFSGNNQEIKQEEKQVEEQENLPHEPIRTPSIADRIEFREHLADIYSGFSTGQNFAKPISEIDRIQEEEKEDENVTHSFSDFRNSSIFSSMFGSGEPEKTKKKKAKINLKDAVIAEVVLNRPKLSKNLKNFNKK